MNKLKGEVSFEHDGASRILVFSIDALIALEEHFDAGLIEIGAKLQGALRASDLKVIFWAGLLQYWPEVTQAEAGLVMSEIGVSESSDLVGRAFQAAFPAPGEVGTPGKGPRRRAAAGTGPASSASGAG